MVTLWGNYEGISQGVGVAMDNAIPSVKEVANFVTKSNLEDGVAFAIEKYVLN
nr:HAD hydrolase family protein [Escherichia coli]